MQQKMTINDLKAMDREMLTPTIVAQVIGCDPYWITLAARDHPEWLKFPFIVMGSRTKIPRLAFIRWMEGEGNSAVILSTEALEVLSRLSAKTGVTIAELASDIILQADDFLDCGT